MKITLESRLKLNWNKKAYWNQYEMKLAWNRNQIKSEVKQKLD